MGINSPNCILQPAPTGQENLGSLLMGSVAEGLLACRWVLATPTRATQHLLAQDHWPERVPRSLPPFPGMLSEPPGADPHAGWCGRGQGKPGRGLDGPSRLQRFTRGAPLGLPDGDYATAPAETTVRRSGPHPATRSSLDCGGGFGRGGL